MRPRYQRSLSILVGVGAATLLLLGCPPAAQEEPMAAESNGGDTVYAPSPQEEVAAGRPPFRAVDLTYMGKDDECAAEWAGDECVMVRPYDATIWKNKTVYNGKPKKVRWWIDDQQEGNYYFEIAYKGADPANNWLGTIPAIDCGDKKTKSSNVAGSVKPGDNLAWPYRITVYACEDGEKADCLCKTDPRIEIHD